MAKESIRREDLKSNIMKMVLFRIDLKGVLDVHELVKEFDEEFEDSFNSYETAFINDFHLEMINLQELSETLSVPVKAIENEEIHRFSNNTFGTDEVVLDLHKFYCILSIDCTNYINIDPYLDFFSQLVAFLIEKNEYLSILRLGLRKVGSEVYFDRDKIFDDFEKSYFNFDFSETQYNSRLNRYIDVLYLDDSSPTINFLRSFEEGYATVEGKAERQRAFQVTLDIDAFFDQETWNKLSVSSVNNVKSTLRKVNDVHLFDLFKMSVTEDFLIRNKS